MSGAERPIYESSFPTLSEIRAGRATSILIHTVVTSQWCFLRLGWVDGALHQRTPSLQMKAGFRVGPTGIEPPGTKMKDREGQTSSSLIVRFGWRWPKRTGCDAKPILLGYVGIPETDFSPCAL